MIYLFFYFFFINLKLKKNLNIYFNIMFFFSFIYYFFSSDTSIPMDVLFFLDDNNINNTDNMVEELNTKENVEEINDGKIIKIKKYLSDNWLIIVSFSVILFSIYFFFKGVNNEIINIDQEIEDVSVEFIADNGFTTNNTTSDIVSDVGNINEAANNYFTTNNTISDIVSDVGNINEAANNYSNSEIYPPNYVIEQLDRVLLQLRFSDKFFDFFNRTHFICTESEYREAVEVIFNKPYVNFNKHDHKLFNEHITDDTIIKNILKNRK